MPIRQPIAIKGGQLINKKDGTLYLGYNGKACFFPDIKVKLSNFVCKGTAYQWMGTIRIAKDWSEKEFNINHFIHEYGHYLQQKELGDIAFVWQIAIKSLLSLLFFPQKHAQRYYEKNASEKGYNFWSKHYRNIHE